jgi:5'-3' exonuclease
MNVHLIDGTYELVRAFYGSPPRRTAAGREVGAVRGLARSMLALLGEPGVTHVAVAFDHVIESFRNALYPGYKTGEGIDADLRAQFDLAEAATRALGIVTWPMVEFEADDAIAAAAFRFAADPRVEQVVIASPDKDFAQCVRGNRVVLWDRRRGIVLDEEGVRAKFGISPESIPDYLALVGDAADGLPGVYGWGKKSAGAVLARHGHIEAIPRNAAEWPEKPRRAYDLAAELERERENALLYRKLATLRLDVPLEEDLEALEWRGARREELEAICRELDEEDTFARTLSYGCRKSGNV